MNFDSNIPLWIEPSALSKCGSAELHESKDGTCSAFLRLDRQRELAYGISPSLDEAIRGRFAEPHLWYKQRTFYQDQCRAFFAEKGAPADNPAWFGVIQNRIGFKYRGNSSKQPKYRDPTECLYKTVPIIPSLDFPINKAHFGFLQHEKSRGRDLQLISQERRRTAKIESDNQTPVTGQVIYLTHPDLVSSDELSITALRSSLSHENSQLMSTTSIVMGRLYCTVDFKGIKIPYVVQQIFTLWSSTAHTAAHARDFMSLEMHQQLYTEEASLIGKIIYDQE